MVKIVEMAITVNPHWVGVASETFAAVVLVETHPVNMVNSSVYLMEVV